jgi:hypothetical protein
MSAMSASVLPVLATAEEHTRELPMSPTLYGVLFMAAFLLLLALVWAFRGTAYKVRDRHSRPPAGGGH